MSMPINHWYIAQRRMIIQQCLNTALFKDNPEHQHIAHESCVKKGEQIMKNTFIDNFTRAKMSFM
jgi:hypothetical protein